MKAGVFLLNAFGINSSSGNPAGAVLNAEGFTYEQKKAIAKKIGFSETAFVEKSQKANFKVTFFTPTEEVDICGHATIAAYSLLLQKKIIKQGKYTHELKAGVLPIEITSDGIILMDLALPVFSEIIPFTDIKEIFNVSEYAITDTGLQPQIVSTGFRDILVPIKDRKTLFTMQIDFEKMAAINKKTNTTGFHVFTLDTINIHAIAHARNFFPLYGITEDAATGSSNSALACYLFTYGKIKTEQIKQLVFEQGYCMNKPSRIIAALQTDGKEIKRVQIGGKAFFMSKREIEI